MGAAAATTTIKLKQGTAWSETRWGVSQVGPCSQDYESHVCVIPRDVFKWRGQHRVIQAAGGKFVRSLDQGRAGQGRLLIMTMCYK